MMDNEVSQLTDESLSSIYRKLTNMPRGVQKLTRLNEIIELYIVEIEAEIKRRIIRARSAGVWSIWVNFNQENMKSTGIITRRFKTLEDAQKAATAYLDECGVSYYWSLEGPPDSFSSGVYLPARNQHIYMRISRNTLDHSYGAWFDKNNTTKETK